VRELRNAPALGARRFEHAVLPVLLRGPPHPDRDVERLKLRREIPQGFGNRRAETGAVLPEFDASIAQIRSPFQVSRISFWRARFMYSWSLIEGVRSRWQGIDPPHTPRRSGGTPAPAIRQEGRRRENAEGRGVWR
jgi:hypothetical protein